MLKRSTYKALGSNNGASAVTVKEEAMINVPFVGTFVVERYFEEDLNCQQGQGIRASLPRERWSKWANVENGAAVQATACKFKCA